MHPSTSGLQCGTFSLLIALLQSVESSIVERPNDITAMVNESTYFYCSTSIRPVDERSITWYHNSLDKGDWRRVYDDGIDIDLSSGTFNLLALSLKPYDAGRYECRDDILENIGASAELTVLETEPVCKDNITTAFNVSLEEGSTVRMRCSLNFIGNLAPTMEWGQSGRTVDMDNRTITEMVETSVTPNANITSTWTIAVDSSYTCNTYFQLNNTSSLNSTATNVPDYNYMYTWSSSVITVSTATFVETETSTSASALVLTSTEKTSRFTFGGLHLVTGVAVLFGVASSLVTLILCRRLRRKHSAVMAGLHHYDMVNFDTTMPDVYGDIQDAVERNDTIEEVDERDDIQSPVFPPRYGPLPEPGYEGLLTREPKPPGAYSRMAHTKHSESGEWPHLHPRESAPNNSKPSNDEDLTRTPIVSPSNIHLAFRASVPTNAVNVSKDIPYDYPKSSVALYGRFCPIAATGCLDFEPDFLCKYATLANYLDRGAFGDVYGPIVLNGLKLALKETKFSVGKVTNELKEKLEKKKDIWTSLEHKNLARIYSVDLSQLPKVMFIVMEYAEGGSLHKTLRSLGHGNRLPIDVVTDWAKQIAEGMMHLHKNDVVHRDLKPANILLMRLFNAFDSPTTIPLKITDFDDIKKHDHTTAMSVLVGTFVYMAPEVLGHERFSKASDVWSFGVVIWEMLSGDIPHKGLEPRTIMSKSIKRELDKLPLEKTFPGDYKRLLNHCWESPYSKRPPFDEIFVALERMAQGEDNCYIQPQKNKPTESVNSQDTLKADMAVSKSTNAVTDGYELVEEEDEDYDDTLDPNLTLRRGPASSPGCSELMPDEPKPPGVYSRMNNTENLLDEKSDNELKSKIAEFQARNLKVSDAADSDVIKTMPVNSYVDLDAELAEGDTIPEDSLQFNLDKNIIKPKLNKIEDASRKPKPRLKDYTGLVTNSDKKIVDNSDESKIPIIARLNSHCYTELVTNRDNNIEIAD